MTKKNLSLLRRSNNRTEDRPAQAARSNISLLDDDNDKKRRKRGDDSDDLNNITGKLYHEKVEYDNDWCPSIASIFKILFSVRISAGIWSTISDCDEVYNYWEPLHFFLYGNGFQTWEYSPIYAIRSYLYILLHAIPLHPFRSFLPHSKIGAFFFLRCILGCCCAFAELYLSSAIARRLGKSIARLYVLFTFVSTGMFISSCAFLPSSFSMTLITVALAAYLERKWFIAIFATAVSSLIGWPFVAILGFPIIAEMIIIHRRLAIRFMMYILTIGVGICVLLLIVDSYYYGKTVLAPLNIIRYNIFSTHGPHLYGIASVEYYIKNLLLNWNIAIIFALVSMPMSMCYFVMRNRKSFTTSGYTNLNNWLRYLPVLLIFISFTLWIVIFFTQPHKEERFLFPIYPHIAIFAAIGVDACYRLSSWLLPKMIYIYNASIWIIFALFIIVSMSRSIALHKNFYAPIDSFVSLTETLNKNTTQLKNNVNVCIGKEWYRYPSSFFLPHQLSNTTIVRLQFIKSHFKGILPKHFEELSLPIATRFIPTDMNDANREEISRYISLNDCDYLIDLETPDMNDIEPNYAEQTNEFVSIYRQKYLLSAHSHALFRAFWIPWLSQRYCIYGYYHVLQRIVL